MHIDATTPSAYPAQAAANARPQVGGAQPFAQALGRAQQASTVEASTVEEQASAQRAEPTLAERRAAVRDVLSHTPPPYARILGGQSPGAPSPIPEFDILFEAIASGEEPLNEQQRTGSNIFSHLLQASVIFESPQQMWDEARAMLGQPAAVRSALDAARGEATTTVTASAETTAAEPPASETPAPETVATTSTAASAVFDAIGGRPTAQQLAWWDTVIAMLSNTVAAWRADAEAAE